MRFHRRLSLVALTLALACATTDRPAGLTKAEVGVRLLNPLFFGAAGTASATFAIGVQNTASVPIIVHAIRLSSPGMLEYSLKPEERQFHQTIESGETGGFSIATTVSGSPGMDPSEPLAVRIFIDFEAGGQRYHDIFNVLNVPKG
jgi:hypothetical protein